MSNPLTSEQQDDELRALRELVTHLCVLRRGWNGADRQRDRYDAAHSAILNIGAKAFTKAPSTFDEWYAITGVLLPHPHRRAMQAAWEASKTAPGLPKEGV